MNILRALGVAGVTVAGFVLVMGAMLIMNQPAEGPQESERVSSIDFTIPTPPPEPPPQRERPQQQQRQQSNRTPLAPPPDLGGSLSGIAVDAPEFEVRGVDNVQDSLLGDLENVALSDDAVDTAPIPQYRPLEYPDRARQRRIEGTVVVSALVDSSGNVQEVRILEADPPGVFDEAVLSAVPNWTFEPARYEGRAVRTWVQIPIPFRLN